MVLIVDKCLFCDKQPVHAIVELKTDIIFLCDWHKIQYDHNGKGLYFEITKNNGDGLICRFDELERTLKDAFVDIVESEIGDTWQIKPVLKTDEEMEDIGEFEGW